MARTGTVAPLNVAPVSVAAVGEAAVGVAPMSVAVGVAQVSVAPVGVAAVSVAPVSVAAVGVAAVTGTPFPVGPLPVAVLGVLATAWVARRAIRSGARMHARQRLARLRRPRARDRWRRAVAAAGSTVRARVAGGARQRRLLVDGLPPLLEHVARGMRSGSSLRRACADAVTAGGPAGRGLGIAVAQAERGRALPSAFAAWAAASVVPEERLAAGALTLAAAAGGPQARAVDGVAATLRERRAVAGEIRAQSAQARLSAVIIGVLPAIFLTWVVVTDRRTAVFLIAGPAGWACLLGGLGLELGGALWMRHLLHGAAP